MGSDEDVSIAELADLVVRNGAPESSIEIAQLPRAGVPPARYVPCVDRAREELSLRAKVPLGEAIRRMFDWYRARSLNTH